MILIQSQYAFPDLGNEVVDSTVFFSNLTQVDIMLGFNSQEGLMVTSLFKGRTSEHFFEDQDINLLYFVF
jgi:hypothetical protein